MPTNDKDISEKRLEEFPDVFADIVNVLLFGGEDVIKPEELESAPPRSAYKAGSVLHEQERDVAKFWRRGRIRLAFLGMENQTDIDGDMPLRVISYDGAAYRDELNSDEPGKPVIRYPVVTLTLYLGTKKRWDGPKSLAECFDIPERLTPFVSDYRLNLAEVAWLPDETIAKFKSDFRFVAEYLKQMRVNRDYHPTKETVDHVQAVLDILTALTEDKDLAKAIVNHTEKGANTMYKHLEELKEKVRIEASSEAESKMGRLISYLLRNGKNDEATLAAEDEAKRHELYLQYGIT